jgi:peptidoglycan/LPS O-acetylase OafA/YrhL
VGALRFLLALAVVLNHAGGFHRYTIVSPSFAVEMFFSISGFYMAMVLTEKYDPVSQIGPFYRSRALRIFAPYYVALALAVALGALTMRYGSGFLITLRNLHLSNLQLIGWALTHLTIIGQEVPLFFSGSPPSLAVNGAWAIPPAWSVSLELIFYIAVPFLVRLNTKALVLLASASLIARIAAAAAGYHADPWLYRFLPFEAVFFLGGMIAYRLSRSRPFSSRQQTVVAVGFLCACALQQPIASALRGLGVPTFVPTWLLYASAVAGIPALFNVTKRLRPDGLLAEFSYPVYLLHWPIIGAVDAFLPGRSGAGRLVAILLATYAASWLLILLIERPIDRLRHRLSIRAGRAARLQEPAASPSPA